LLSGGFWLLQREKEEENEAEGKESGEIVPCKFREVKENTLVVF